MTGNNSNVRVFLSYAREGDDGRSQKLQRALERFAMPWYRFVVPWHRGRMLRVFRDETHLGAEADLPTAIAREIEEADYFILLASPQTRESRWVDREVSLWLEKHAVGSLLLVIREGELACDETLQGFTWNESTPLPPRLRSAFVKVAVFVDMSAFDPGQWTLRWPNFADRVATLVARFRNCSKEQIWGENLRQERRTNRTIATVIVLLTALALSTGMFAFRENLARHRAEQQEQRAENTYYMLLEDRMQKERDQRKALGSLVNEGADMLSAVVNDRRPQLDDAMQRLDEARMKDRSNLLLLIMLDKTIQTRQFIASIKKEHDVEARLLVKKNELATDIAIARLLQNDFYLSHFNTSLRQERKRLRDTLTRNFADIVPNSAQDSLWHGRLYVQCGAFDYIALMDPSSTEDRKEARQVLQRCLDLFELAKTANLLSDNEQELLKKTKNELYELSEEKKSE